MERCDSQALINTRPALQWLKTYSRSVASRVARCNVDMVGEALQHICTAKIQPGNSWNILAMTSRA